jgi:hypothetical protein
MSMISRKNAPVVLLSGLILMGATLLAAPVFPGAEDAAAQQPQPGAEQASPPRPDTVDLVFEREVFTYPTYQRRNPFIPLVGGAEGGPRYEDLALLGIIESPDPELSVALFGLRSEMQGGDREQGQLPQTYRVRRGDVLGNVRILDIQEKLVVVEVDEFGLTEQRIMELQRTGSGQGGLS